MSVILNKTTELKAARKNSIILDRKHEEGTNSISLFKSRLFVEP